ncbi:hypothetical protein BV22DRAFT_1026375, partial [Leucogyrophana mollusca]
SVIRRVILHVRDTIRTQLNSFGLFREYPHRPTYDPDAFVLPEHLSYRARERLDPVPPSDSTPKDPPPPWPFASMSIYRLMKWRHSGSIQKSEEEVSRLVREVILADDFKVDDLKGFSMKKQNEILDNASRTGSMSAPRGDDWREVAVPVQVPLRSPDPSGAGKTFVVPGLHYRPLVQVIKSAFSEMSAKAFHLSPFRRFWRHPVSGAESRVYDELYTSDAWIKAHDALQKQPPEPGCTLERVIAALMFSSDATMLASFGTAKAWPLYLSFGNLSKYVRARPTSGSVHHVAFIPSVSLAHHFRFGSFAYPSSATR